MNMSLPVQIFAKKSTLELMADTFGFFPKFMKLAVEAKDLIEQMKYVTTSFMFVSACSPSVEKPFNPILGETFECTIGGIPFYF